MLERPFEYNIIALILIKENLYFLLISAPSQLSTWINLLTNS